MADDTDRDGGGDWRDIKAVALGVVRRGDEVLLMEFHDGTAGESFYRPPGGGVEFDEPAAEAVRREFREELGLDVEVGDRLAVLENRYSYEGERGHEYVLLFAVEPRDDAVYETEALVATETDGERFRVTWVSLSAFHGPDGETLYPHGTRAVLESG